MLVVVSCLLALSLQNKAFNYFDCEIIGMTIFFICLFATLVDVFYMQYCVYVAARLWKLRYMYANLHADLKKSQI